MKFKAKHNGSPRQRVKGMNGIETAYAFRLKLMEQAGEIHGYAFEAIKFRLAESTFYSPDFIVYAADGVIEVHEVKGHWEDDARVKIKVLAAMFPIRVKAVTRKKGEWIFEDFTN